MKIMKETNIIPNIEHIKRVYIELLIALKERIRDRELIEDYTGNTFSW